MLPQPTDRIEAIREKRLIVLADDITRATSAFSKDGKYSEHLLTPAEHGVLKLVGLGMTNAEIARALFISTNTVRTHLKRIHEKCDVQGRARLAVVADRIFRTEGS